MRRWLRVVLTLLVTALAAAYVLARIDVRETARTIGDAHVGYLLASLAIMLVTQIPMAWRWQLLLAARGIADRLGWLFRAYLVSYAAGQILPTAVGGDAMRIYESARRHPGRTGDLAGSVLLERALGGAATVLLAAIGFLLALGRYDVGAYLWLEGAFVAATVLFGVVVFSRAARRPLRAVRPLLAALRLERPVRAVYEGMHAYRTSAAVLVAAFAVTLAIQTVRIFAIWSAGKATGIDLSARVYFVMGPLLFLVMLVPFTLNGFAVREAFFVSFLGTLGVAADAAFAAGFLFFVVTIMLALPGAAILAWEGLRAAGRRAVPHG